jgi:hypothetical protein
MGSYTFESIYLRSDGKKGTHGQESRYERKKEGAGKGWEGCQTAIQVDSCEKERGKEGGEKCARTF